MLALSIRQPYAELILQGKKRIEYRTMTAANLIGQRFFIYASKKQWPVASGQWPVDAAKQIWSDDLAVTTRRRGEHQDGPPEWMLQLAEALILGKLPTGVIVGSAIIEKVTRGEQFYEWHLADVERASRLRRPERHPQPVWFKPF